MDETKNEVVTEGEAAVTETPAQAAEAASEQEEKKKNKPSLLMIIIIIILLLLSLFALIFVPKWIYAAADPDVTVMKRLNETYAKYEKDNGKAKDINEAMDDALACGFIVDNMKFINDTRYIVWDSVYNCFHLYDGKKAVVLGSEKASTGVDLWIFPNSIPTESEFSVYKRGVCITYETVVDVSGEEQIVEHDHGDHDYAVTVEGNNRVYSCDDCEYSYSIRIKN